MVTTTVPGRLPGTGGSKTHPTSGSVRVQSHFGAQSLAHREVELVHLYGGAHWGCGYASEGTRAVMGCAAELRIGRLVSGSTSTWAATPAFRWASERGGAPSGPARELVGRAAENSRPWRTAAGPPSRGRQRRMRSYVRSVCWSVVTTTTLRPRGRGRGPRGPWPRRKSGDGSESKHFTVTPGTVDSHPGSTRAPRRSGFAGGARRPGCRQTAAAARYQDCGASRSARGSHAGALTTTMPSNEEPRDRWPLADLSDPRTPCRRPRPGPRTLSVGDRYERNL